MSRCKTVFSPFCLSFIAFVLLLTQQANAHGLPSDLTEKLMQSGAFRDFALGFVSIFPYGSDHLLFIACLVLLSPILKAIIWQNALLGLSFSLSFLLAVLMKTPLPAQLIEILIGISVLWMAVENLLSSKLRRFRLIAILFFGLMHGLGFVNAFSALNLSSRPDTSILFNSGLVFALITTVTILYIVLIRWFGGKPYFRKWILFPFSGMAAVIAMIWIVERVMRSV